MSVPGFSLLTFVYSCERDCYRCAVLKTLSRNQLALLKS